MPSKYDIFISYGHLDDEDPAGDMKGWVDLLVERLPRLISSSLGYLPKIWRDQRSLTGDALLRAAIEEGISNSLLFHSDRVATLRPVRLVSPRARSILQKSTASQRARASFANLQSDQIAAAVSSREKGAGTVTQELIGHAFYEMEGDMPVEFSPDVVPAKDPRYWTVLRRLAWDISTLLAAVKDPDQQRQTKELPTEGPQKFIYLAETNF